MASYTRFSLGLKNEQADAGRDGRTYFARPNSEVANVDKKKTVGFFVAFRSVTYDHESKCKQKFIEN